MSNFPETSQATKWSRTMRTLASIFLNQDGGCGTGALCGLSGTGTGISGCGFGRVTLPVMVVSGAPTGVHEATAFQKRFRLGSPCEVHADISSAVEGKVNVFVGYC